MDRLSELNHCLHDFQRASEVLFRDWSLAASDFPKTIQTFNLHRMELLKAWFHDAPLDVYVTGSYSKNQACPYSDLDLILMLPPRSSVRKYESWVEEKIYPLYNIFPKVAHVFRSESEIGASVTQDFRIYYSLEEAKRIRDGESLHLEGSLKPPKDELLRHTRLRWDRYHNAPLLVEMNLKDGPGAILDYGNLRRLSRKSDDSMDPYLWSLLVVRVFLHFRFNRAQEVIRQDVRREIPNLVLRNVFEATTMGYLRTQLLLDPTLRSDSLTHLDEWFQASKESKRQFCFRYLSGDFESLFPQMRQQLGTLSESPAHDYTVGWHSAECLKVLKDLQAGLIVPQPLGLEQALARVDRVEILNLALFLHDGSKGEPEEHSIAGARWIRDHLASSLDSKDVSFVAELVERHLDFHGRAVKDDLLSMTNEQLRVKWPEDQRFLAYLYLLTVVDIVSTSRKLWTVWRAQVLGNYFLRLLEAHGENPKDTAPVLDQYRMVRDLENQKLDSELFVRANVKGVGAGLSHDRSSGFDVLAVAVTHDQPGLLSAIIAALYRARVGVWRARTYPFESGILDLIWVYPYDSVDLRVKPAQQSKVQKSVESAVLKLEKFHKKSRPVICESIGEVLNKVIPDGEIRWTPPLDATRPGILQVSCPDREGLLVDILEAIRGCGWNILSADIGTTGVQAIDRFLLQASATSD